MKWFWKCPHVRTETCMLKICLKVFILNVVVVFLYHLVLFCTTHNGVQRVWIFAVVMCYILHLVLMKHFIMPIQLVGIWLTFLYNCINEFLFLYISNSVIVSTSFQFIRSTVCLFFPLHLWNVHEDLHVVSLQSSGVES